MNSVIKIKIKNILESLCGHSSRNTPRNTIATLPLLLLTILSLWQAYKMPVNTDVFWASLLRVFIPPLLSWACHIETLEVSLPTKTNLCSASNPWGITGLGLHHIQKQHWRCSDQQSARLKPRKHTQGHQAKWMVLFLKPIFEYLADGDWTS